MVWKIPREIVDGLKKDIDLFIELTDNEITCRQDAMCCYIFGILSEQGGVSTMFKLLTAKGIDKDIIKDFLSYSLKMRFKMENGKWSWAEMDEFNIPFDAVQDCSTDYQLPNN